MTRVNVSLAIVLVICTSLIIGQSRGEKKPAASKPASKKFRLERLRGKVVFLAEALKRKYGIRSVSEASKRVLALEAKDGKLHPLVEDFRGRAFRLDKRLRTMDAELLVRRYKGSPTLQVIGVYTLEKKGKFELDYWCDICAIALYELKPCDCCQGAIRLRKRKR